MGYSTFSNNLARLQEQNYFDILRQSTGKDIQSISEAPTRLMDSKNLVAQKNMKENYVKQNEYAASEMRAGEDAATAIADGFQTIRELSISSTNVTIDGNVSSLAVYIKGIITDIIRNANTDFNGKYLFGGTKTTPNSIINDYPTMNNMPFELVEGPPTADNPSGFEIVFKGNNDNRTINKDGHSNEAINLTGEQLFGEGSIEYFKPIIEIYNILQFKPGTNVVRESLDSLSREEKQQIADLQAQIASNKESTDKEIAIFASRRDRIDTVNLQMTEEVVRLKEVNSLKEDVDMSKLLLKLAQEETSLQYSLNAGSKIQQYSLFKYI
jgi:flagellar hook-associated protein 3 FlgL